MNDLVTGTNNAHHARFDQVTIAIHDMFQLARYDVEDLRHAMAVTYALVAGRERNVPNFDFFTVQVRLLDKHPDRNAALTLENAQAITRRLISEFAPRL